MGPHDGGRVVALLGALAVEQVQHWIVVGVLQHGVDGRNLASGYEQPPCRSRAVDVGLVKGLDDERHALRLGILVGAEPKDRNRTRDCHLGLRVMVQRCELVAQDDERRRENKVAVIYL